MSAEQDEPPPLEEEAPPPPGGPAPPDTEDPAPPGPGDEAPPPPGDEAPPAEDEGAPQAEAPEEAPSGEDAASLPPKRPSSVKSDLLNLIPSSERIVFPDEEEEEAQRVRARPAPRTVQSMLSEALSQSSHRSSKYFRSMSGLPNLQETLKERQVLLTIHKCHFYFKYKCTL